MLFNIKALRQGTVNGVLSSTASLGTNTNNSVYAVVDATRTDRIKILKTIAGWSCVIANCIYHAWIIATAYYTDYRKYC